MDNFLLDVIIFAIVAAVCTLFILAVIPSKFSGYYLTSDIFSKKPKIMTRLHYTLDDKVYYADDDSSKVLSV